MEPERRKPRSSQNASPPAECANCGATIARHARACPECGADERTGWREQSIYDGLDLPEEAFDDGAALRPRRRAGTTWYWIVTAVLLIALSLAGFVFLR